MNIKQVQTNEAFVRVEPPYRSPWTCKEYSHEDTSAAAEAIAQDIKRHVDGIGFISTMPAPVHYQADDGESDFEVRETLYQALVDAFDDDGVCPLYVVHTRWPNHQHASRRRHSTFASLTEAAYKEPHNFEILSAHPPLTAEQTAFIERVRVAGLAEKEAK